MSLLNWIQDWRIGGAFAVLLFPLLFLPSFSRTTQPNISINGWTVSKVNGLFSRVRLFIKSTRQTGTGGGQYASKSRSNASSVS